MANQELDDEASNSFSIFPPDWENLTPEYLASHGVRDGIRDFAPGVGRFSRERWRSSLSFPLPTTINNTPLTPIEVIVRVKEEMDRLRKNAEQVGFTVGHTPGSIRAMEESRELFRTQIEAKNF